MVDAASQKPIGLRVPPWPVIAALAAAGLLAITYITAYRISLKSTRDAAVTQATFFRSTLDAALERPEALPFVLARDSAVVEALADGDRAALNRRLAGFARAARVEAIYLMDARGMTIAASNYDAQVTFLGQSYAFRPYFNDSMEGRRGSFFAIGATSGRPGYFVSEPVRDTDGRVSGVIAVKTGLEDLAAAWAASGERVMVANRDGVVVLSSLPDTIYRTLTPLTEFRRRAVAAAQQFGTEPLTPLNYRSLEEGSALLDDTRYLEMVQPVGRLGWQLRYLSPVSTAHARARATVSVVLIGLMIAIAAALILRTRRMRSALRASQDDRRALRRLNETLGREVEERRAAEARLGAAQSELLAASRLAALGRLSASVTHELGQPLSALRNYIAGLRLNGPGEDLGRFADRMDGVALRMEAITRQLRFFAQPGQDGFEVFDLAETLPVARELLTGDLERLGIALALETRKGDEPVPVRGNRMRLEQVLINLLQNARDALTDHDAPQITVRLETRTGRARLSVADNGAGIEAEIAERLFEPFTSTKASGAGMGLGLAISQGIIADHTGTLTAKTAPGGGALFMVELPLVSGGGRAHG